MTEYIPTLADKYGVRGADLIPYAIRETTITVVGLGGIGSWTAEVLGRMGAGRMVVVDPDIVGEENIHPQLYTPDDLGATKAEVTMGRLFALGVGKVDPVRLRVGEPKDLVSLADSGGIVLSCVDSMAARRVIYEGARLAETRWLIDGRMGGLSYRAYTVDLHDPVDVARYEASLYSDAEAVELPCTARATAFTGAAIGGLMAGCVWGVLTGQRPPSVIGWEFPEWGIFAGVRYDRPTE